jgi:DNA repair exonuclease SbcCD ATPase subunit
MSEHPEAIPKINSYDKFPFSAKASLSVQSELQSQLETLNERIEKIASNVIVGDMPLVKFVLQTSHNKNELKKFAKAVDRVADLIEAVDQLESKLKIIETAQKDPEWFAFAFGDFSQEIDDDLSQIFN